MRPIPNEDLKPWRLVMELNDIRVRFIENGGALDLALSFMLWEGVSATIVNLEYLVGLPVGIEGCRRQFEALLLRLRAYDALRRLGS